MAVLKDFRCDNCNNDFEKRIGVNEPNPNCPNCGAETHWLPKLNKNPHQVSYVLRVLCDGFSNKIHKERVI